MFRGYTKRPLHSAPTVSISRNTQKQGPVNASHTGSYGASALSACQIYKVVSSSSGQVCGVVSSGGRAKISDFFLATQQRTRHVMKYAACGSHVGRATAAKHGISALVMSVSPSVLKMLVENSMQSFTTSSTTAISRCSQAEEWKLDAFADAVLGLWGLACHGGADGILSRQYVISKLDDKIRTQQQSKSSAASLAWCMKRL